jgi:hypothetical protein
MTGAQEVGAAGPGVVLGPGEGTGTCSVADAGGVVVGPAVVAPVVPESCGAEVAAGGVVGGAVDVSCGAVVAGAVVCGAVVGCGRDLVAGAGAWSTCCVVPPVVCVAAVGGRTKT